MHGMCGQEIKLNTIINVKTERACPSKSAIVNLLFHSGIPAYTGSGNMLYVLLQKFITFTLKHFLKYFNLKWNLNT